MARRPVVDEDDKFKSEQKLVLDEAKERWKRAAEWESEWRQLALEDIKFANGDSDNGWQWPESVKNDRDVNNRPCLTVNKTKTIVLQLANEAKQNPPEPRIKPVGDKVSFDAAQVWEGLIRHIMYISNAGQIFGSAKENQLECGIGYWRVVHDFVDDRAFDQELKLAPLDPFEVYLDCDIKNPDGSDAMWAFIFTEYNRKEFERLFPDIPLPRIGSGPGFDDRDDWIRKDSVRVAEYYRIKIVEDELIYLEDEQGKTWTGLRSELPPGSIWTKTLKGYEDGKIVGDFKKRPVKNRQLEWFKIAGDDIIDSTTWSADRKLKGKYVPVVREPGRERRVEGRLYRAGIVRSMKDPQRMYNYNTSAEVEIVATQTKTPYIVAMASIEGNEAAWNNANTTNAAYLTFRHKDDDGDDIPPPQRTETPTPSQGYLEGIRIAAAEMEMVSGVKTAQEQNPALERTPKAIDQRMRAGEVTNYDFTDNEMLAIRHTAVVLIDLAPHIYDTARIVKMRAKDGTISEVHIDPESDIAYQKDKPTGEDKAIKVLFNPTIGKFAVEADVGPAYATQRQEAWAAFVEITTRSPELMNIMGDLGFLAADWPMAQQIAERIRRNIEHNQPWLLEDGQIGPLVAKLQQDNADLTKQLGELMEKLVENRIRLRGKDELRDIEVADSQNKRLTAETGAVESLVKIGEGHGLKKLVQQTLAEMLGFDPNQIEKANKDVIAEQQTAADGANGAGSNAS